jgi:hypothetical protein
VIVKPQVGEIVIELKGKGVDHAIDQVMATTKYLTDNSFRHGKIACLIVCSLYPRITTKVQRAKAAYMKAFSLTAS